jgi:hypothetical protein
LYKNPQPANEAFKSLASSSSSQLTGENGSGEELIAGVTIQK